MRDFHLPGRSEVLALNGMAATSHPLASRTAIRILEDGGNAVDAAIAAAVLLGLCEPAMTGIGGDCFVLLKPPGEERILGLNGSGRAPAGLSAERLRAAGHAAMPVSTADAVTIPGAVDALCRLSAEWGRLGLAASLAPAIAHAEAGVPVAPRTAFDWADSADTLQGAARQFYLTGGHAPRAGQVFRAPAQAEALRRIAREGRAGFYEGPVAEDIVASLRAAGGCHTLDDMAATACDLVEPLTGSYRGHCLVELPPNGQGATALLLAAILEGFDIGGLDPRGAERVHLEAEATKLAYDARDRFIADPAHVTALDHMLAPGTARALAGLIDRDRAMDDPAPVAGSVHAAASHRETVYLTVVDRDRMAVSLIYSIYHPFGSGIASDRFGILLQNRGAGFTLEAGHPNLAGPGKRPMHTIIPAMLVQDSRVTGSFGVMGGRYQATGHVRVLSNLADYGMGLQEAIDCPRAFAMPGELSVERGYAPRVRAALEAMGHRVTVPDGPIGGGQAILIGADGVLTGASDPRKDGCALGY
jgi:gamma-glutamyltranspeptidase/glutathione hydrolase